MKKADLNLMITYLADIGRLTNGERPLIILIENALLYTDNPEIMEALRGALAELEIFYAPVKEDTLAVPEELTREK